MIQTMHPRCPKCKSTTLWLKANESDVMGWRCEEEHFFTVPEYFAIEAVKSKKKVESVPSSNNHTSLYIPTDFEDMHTFEEFIYSLHGNNLQGDIRWARKLKVK